MKEKQVTIYAIGENGNGYVQKIGEYDLGEDIKIRVGMFTKDTLITIEYN